MSKELIDALGGVKVVSEQLQASPGAVANWRLTGRQIPWHWRPTIAAIATEKGVAIPSDFLSPQGVV